MAAAKRKRKATQVELQATPTKKRGRPPGVKKDQQVATPKKRAAAAKIVASRITRSSIKGAITKPAVAKKAAKPLKASKQPVKATKAEQKAARGKAKEAHKASKPSKVANDEVSSNLRSELSINIPSALLNDVSEDNAPEDVEGRSYWLMKAEPDTRILKNIDVKFSIDDLLASTAPDGEPWDGVRNATARNNMRLMMKGDQAFFYHSNTKVPGIVGTMEIVQEHSVDETALDLNHPYYDPGATREAPKWCIVNVRLIQKFPQMIKLKDLQKYSREGGILERLQTLKMPRLSVSKVSPQEWNFIMSLVESEEAAGPAQESASAGNA